MPRSTKAKINQKQLDAIAIKLNTIAVELKTAFLEMDSEIESLIIGLIANENVCLVGPAGEGKSNLTNAFTSLIGGSCFSYQINAFTQPDNVIGSPSLKEKRDNDRDIIKVDNMAPDSEIVYFDEVFKANNQMMNSLLLLLNEREVDIGEGQRLPTKNRMIIGSSNEYPEDDELKAFWDRWVIRNEVKGLKKDSSFNAFWNGYGTGGIGVVDTKKAVKMADIDKLRSNIWAVDSSPIFKNVVQLRFELMKAGISLSTRRWGKIKKILHAVALRNGRLISSKKDLNFLKHCIWQDSSQIDVIETAIAEAMGGDLANANKTLAMANRIYKEILTANIPDGPAGIPVIVGKFEEIKLCKTEVDKLDRSDVDVDHVCHQVQNLVNLVAQLIQQRIA